MQAGSIVAERYVIERPLCRGTFVDVHAAIDSRTRRHVAIKVARAGSDTGVGARLRTEARAGGAINSDHVAAVLDLHEDPLHGALLVLELLEGERLVDVLKRTGSLALPELHPIVAQAWVALCDAHRAGIVHRNVKSSNLFLEARSDGGPRVRLVDFGFAKLAEELASSGSPPSLTDFGRSQGAFSFMAPELIGKTGRVDHRADIYALATVTYQALSGQLPFADKSLLVMVEAKTKTDPRSLAVALGRGAAPELERFLARGLARDPVQRFPTAVEARDAWRELWN